MTEITTLPFFGEVGISSTSANHIANLTKESVRNAHEKLAATQFYTEKVGLLTSSDKATVHTGMSSDTLNDLPELVNMISQANSLIAYLREAIKEKERRMKEAMEYTDTEAYQNLLNLQSSAKLDKPVKDKYPTADDIKKTWTVGEQEKYLSLEAEAAALGKFIHEDGFMSLARIDLMHKIQSPNRVDVNGINTIVHVYEPTVTVEDVDKVYNGLQSKYRSVQAELNGMKKKIDDTITAQTLDIDNRYNAAMRDYNARMKQWERDIDEFNRDMEMKRKELVKEVQNLKIVIPNRLKSIYDALNGQK